MKKRYVNPFSHKIDLKRADYFRVILGTIFLVPIRLILILFLFIMLSMLTKFANYLLEKWKLEKRDDIKWRCYLQQLPVILYRGMFFVAGFHRVKVIDKSGPNDKEGAKVFVVAPHTSPFDILIVTSLGMAPTVASPVARHDIVDIPLFGNIIKILDPVFVQRDSKSSKDSVINSVLDRIQYGRVLFFPEGTCGNRRALFQFKPGAFTPGLPIQPIIIVYDQGGDQDTLSWTWDGPPTWKSIWLTLCRWRTGLELIKLPVYYPSEDERNDPELYAKNVSRLFSKELEIPVLEYAFHDIKYLQYRVFNSPVCLKLLKLCDKIQNQPKPGFKFNQKGVKRGKSKAEKIQIFEENVIYLIRDVLEGIELKNSKSIGTMQDLIFCLNLDKCPDLCESSSLKELYECLQLSSQNPSTTHLQAVLHFVKSFWKRLENCFKTFSKSEVNNESDVISNESLKDILWLALGISISDNDVDYPELTSINDNITFENFKRILSEDFVDCVEQNARQLFDNDFI